MQALSVPRARFGSAAAQTSRRATVQRPAETLACCSARTVAPGARHARRAAAAAPHSAAPRLRSVAVAAQQQDQQQPSSSSSGSGADSDLVFVAKGIAVSFAGGALIKYGSLLIDLPHTANAPVALAMVLGPPLIYAAVLASRGSGGQQGGSS